MVETVKGDFDVAAEKLREAARDNLPAQCAEFFGRASQGIVYVNAEALRIAAESKSYEAFERMLELSGEHACGVTSEYSVGLGADWKRVQEIAETDERIASAIQRYEEQIDRNIDEMFGAVDIEQQAASSGGVVVKALRFLGIR